LGGTEKIHAAKLFFLTKFLYILKFRLLNYSN